MMSTCIGCGYCCRKAPCGVISKMISEARNGKLSDILFARNWEKEGCPMLEWNGERWLCGLIFRTQDIVARQALMDSLAMGAGCTSGLNTYQLTNHVPTPKELENEGDLLKKLNSQGRNSE